MLFRDNQDMYGRFRFYVRERDKLVRFKQKICWNFFIYNFAEDAVHNYFILSLSLSMARVIGKVSCIPESMSRIMILPSKASFCPIIRLYGTPSLEARRNCPRMESFESDWARGILALRNSSIKARVFLLAAMPNWIKNTLGFSILVNSSCAFSSMRSIKIDTTLSMPIPPPAAGRSLPAKTCPRYSYLSPPATVIVLVSSVP